jgi:O-acetyl-ADP-ribose deacetylase
VIHAVGPVWHGGKADEDELLASCYRRALELCQANALSSVAFPAISTGVYSFPADRAAGIAVATVADALAAAPDVTKVVFCCFSRDSGRLHETALAGVGSPCAD